LETLENWTKALDEGFGLNIVYLDYRKAFDSVPHRRLIEKLKGFGINGKLLQWLESFDTSRTKRVMLRGNLFRDCGGVEWSSTRTVALSAICERVAILDYK